MYKASSGRRILRPAAAGKRQYFNNSKMRMEKIWDIFEIFEAEDGERELDSCYK